MPYIKIDPMGEVPIRKLHSGGLSLELLQDEVGGLIEPIYRLLPEITDRVPTAVMLVNEEGIIKDLHFNPLATVLHGDAIFGDALLLKTAVVNEDGEEAFAELTEDEAKEIRKFLIGGNEL